MNTTVLVSVGIPTVWFIGGVIAARISYSHDMKPVIDSPSEIAVEKMHNQAIFGMLAAALLWPIFLFGGIAIVPFVGLWWCMKRFVTGGFKAKRNRYLQGQPIDGAKAS